MYSKAGMLLLLLHVLGFMLLAILRIKLLVCMFLSLCLLFCSLCWFCLNEWFNNPFGNLLFDVCLVTLGMQNYLESWFQNLVSF
uniref:Uncharacterized protein At2g13780 n=1 Tax=Arabidopsis thaliana TaxID=3702 RepID=Q9SKG6_ARATH|nr:unknown protein [Arabidopsis thaliana]